MLPNMVLLTTAEYTQYYCQRWYWCRCSTEEQESHQTIASAHAMFILIKPLMISASASLLCVNTRNWRSQLIWSNTIKQHWSEVRKWGKTTFLETLPPWVIDSHIHTLESILEYFIPSVFDIREKNKWTITNLGFVWQTFIYRSFKAKMLLVLKSIWTCNALHYWDQQSDGKLYFLNL